MRIAFITTGFSPDEKDGDGSNSIHFFIKEISEKSEIEAVIFSLYYPLSKREYKFYDLTVYSYGRKLNSGKVLKFFSWMGLKKKFEQEQKKKPFDLIHSFWCGESGYTAIGLGKKFNIPVIASVCGGEVANIPEIDYGSQRKIFQRYFVRKTFEEADLIHSLSIYVSNILNLDFGKYSNKVITLPFGVDEKIFYPLKVEKKSDEIKLISVTNAVPVKAHDILLQAFRKALDRNNFLRLEIYGRNCPEKLKDQVIKFGLSSYVSLFPFVKHESVPLLMNSGDIYIISSLYEAQNISLVEAAFCGLPVISTDVGCAREITENIVTPGDFKSLSEKIIYVADNLNKEKEKSLDRRCELLGKFSIKNVTDRFIELYKTMI